MGPQGLVTCTCHWRPGSHKRLSGVQVPEPPTIVPLHHPITSGVIDTTDLTTNLVFITWNLGKVTSYLMAPKTGHWHQSPGISHIYPKNCDKVFFKSYGSRTTAVGITDLGIAGACQDRPKDSPLGISYNQDPEEPEDTRVCAHCKAVSCLGDSPQSRRSGTQRCC